ncbi:hypothetical protein AAHC03_04687 [Spirometra sp. Aus1]
MVSAQSSLVGLRVTVDANEVNFPPLEVPGIGSDSKIYCDCQTEFCECQSKLGVTALAAKQVYSHLGYPNGRDDIASEGFRLDTLHVWGTQDLSTSDLLQWMAEFSPKDIEWIDDFSCNIVFANENTALRVFNKLAEPFDRRVALAAMAAVAAVMDKKAPLAADEDTEMGDHKTENGEGKNKPGLREGQTHPLSFSTGSLKSITENMPTSGRWFKATTSPDRALSLFLRFAHKSDVKLPGAERRSNYYKRYGNPNYSGMVGILSRSFRRRAQTQRRNEGGASDGGAGDLRRVHYLCCDCGHTEKHLSSSLPHLSACCCCATNGSAAASDTNPRQDRRKLVSYEDLYEDDFVDDSDDLADLARDFDEGLISVRSDVGGVSRNTRVSTRAGNRREAAACGFASPKQPRKWPRNERTGGQLVFDRLGPSDRVVPFKPSADSREPWAGELTSGEDFRGFKGSASRQTAGGGRVSAKQRLGSRHGKANAALATITLLPDPDVTDAHRPLTSMRMVADLEEANIFSQIERRHQSASERRPRHARNDGDVWHRLG